MRAHIVLVEPEIPQNTGNIARTCAATRTALHLIKPLGFSLDDRYLKRAGLDYWESLDLNVYDTFDELYLKYRYDSKFFFATTKAKRGYADVEYEGEYFIVFGKETKGLDEDLLAENSRSCIRIPMVESIRSLNLSNSVAIILYEALRQNKFYGLEVEGGIFF